jgi:PAS domain S-box-containing protein
MSEPTDGSEGAERRRVGDETMFRQVLDMSGIGVFVLGPDFTVEWTNGTVEEFLGLTHERVVGVDKRKLIRETVADVFERPERFADTVLATYENNTYPEEFTCHVRPGEDREERWLRHRSEPIETGSLAGGRIEHYTDVTEGARGLDRKNRAIDAAPIGITLTDARREDNPVVFANEQFTELTGYDSSAVMGWNHRRLQGPATREEPVAELRRAIDAGEPTTVELRNYRADGTMFWNRVSIAPIRDDDGTGFGLSIVQEVAEMHDWQVTVTESDAGGARFAFTRVGTGE